MDGTLYALDRDAAKLIFGCKDDASLQQAVDDVNRRGDAEQRLVVRDYEPLAKAYEAVAESREQSGLNFVLLGGRPLHEGPERLMRLVRPDIVPPLAAELKQLDVDAEDAFGEETLRSEHQAMCEFYEGAARNQCAVLFVAPAPE